MPRIVVIGNAGAGKATLARNIARRRGVRHVEGDRLPWQPGWVQAPGEAYEARHGRLIAELDWVIDGLGRQASIRDRVERATEIVLVDMPLWMHFRLAAERQFEWRRGTLRHPPAGIAQPPPTRAMFESIWEVDRDWMPGIRAACDAAERAGTPVIRLGDAEQLARYGQAIEQAAPEQPRG